MANQIEEIAIEQNINFKELVKNAYMQVNNLSPEKWWASYKDSSGLVNRNINYRDEVGLKMLY